MKVIILAGGLGTRLSEYTDKIPKPMVRIGNVPILVHIMNIYSKFDHNDFYIALGYKSEEIKRYFLNYKVENSNIKIDLSSGSVECMDEAKSRDWRVSLIETGLHSMTGGRIARLKKFIGNETFMLTYGDGLSNIDIDKLTKFHKTHKKLVTVSGVRPTARFGALEIDGDTVISFKEKPQASKGRINGGFFVCEPGIFDLIDSDETDFEKDVLEEIAKDGELKVFKHNDFWQCMDTKKDKDYLEILWTKGAAPWK